MFPSRPLTHFAQVLTDDNTRHINLGTDRPGSTPELLAQLSENGTVHFTNSPRLSPADVQLVAKLAADYKQTQRLLHEHTPQDAQQTNGNWFPITEQIKAA